ncbi:Carbohydrate transport and metabolism [Salix suchowensis]|nr:Carbohydrate transport and metabolism [Salix suchowensis]
MWTLRSSEGQREESFDPPQVKNQTWALWTWHRNQDSRGGIADQIYMVREPDKCPIQYTQTKRWNQARLQQNLIYLAAIADCQPHPSTMHAHFPSSGIIQPGAHYMQQHPQAQQMTPPALMAARSSVLQYAQTADLSASTTTSFTQPARHELRWKHMTSYDAK